MTAQWSQCEVMRAEHKTITVRMSEGLRARLAVSAARERRSLNNLIVYLLEQAVARDEANNRPNDSQKDSHAHPHEQLTR